MAAYNSTLLIWLGYTLAKSPARDAASTLLRPQRWEQSLSDIQHPLPADSLIPMFEGMVDRALSRTHARHRSHLKTAARRRLQLAATVVPMSGSRYLRAGRARRIQAVTADPAAQASFNFFLRLRRCNSGFRKFLAPEAVPLSARRDLCPLS